MSLFNIVVLLIMIAVTVWAANDMLRFFWRKRHRQQVEASLNQSLRHAVDEIGPAPAREDAADDHLIVT